MDIRHFRYFVAVAESLSFVKAARNLHMSQPPLSKRIADLEEEFGVRLFDRSSNKIALTAAGEGLLPQARAAVQAFDAAMRVARAVAPSQSRRLRIALPPETSRNVLLDVINQLHRESVEVEMIEASTSEQRHLLESGEVDVGVLRHPFDYRGLRVSPPLAQPMGVLMHVGHPLATAQRLRLSDLQPYPLVHFQRHTSPGLYDEMLDLCRKGGYVPPEILHGVRMTAVLLVTHQAVAFATERLLKRRGHTGSGELTWKPLEGTPIHWWTSAVCRTEDWDRLTRMAVNIITDALQQNEHWMPLPRPATKRLPSARRERVGSAP
jgi:DNA-binding transcriptional LysR family regulator